MGGVEAKGLGCPVAGEGGMVGGAEMVARGPFLFCFGKWRGFRSRSI